MQWRARVVAPVLAVALGVGGGVTTALVTEAGSSGSTQAKDSADPLDLGVPLDNLGCRPLEAILVVANGETRADLNAGLADNESAARYLDTRASCQAHLGPKADDPPTYLLYKGPYATAADACRRRMTGFYSSAYVATLNHGATSLVKCPCALAAKDAPILTPSPKPSATDSVWARSLQSMLRDGDPSSFPQKWINGTYDERTRRYIIDHFQTPAGLLGRNGLMDTSTWQLVRAKYCRLYNY